MISSDSPGMGRACSDLGVTALVCREKVEKLCVSWWGSNFCNNGTRPSAFLSWWAIQIFRGKLDNFWILWKSTMIFSFYSKTQWFPNPNRILRPFSCKMLLLGLNLEFPGAVFFDGESGHQTFKKRTRLGVEGVRGG